MIINKFVELFEGVYEREAFGLTSGNDTVSLYKGSMPFNVEGRHYLNKRSLDSLEYDEEDKLYILNDKWGIQEKYYDRVMEIIPDATVFYYCSHGNANIVSFPDYTYEPPFWVNVGLYDRR